MGLLKKAVAYFSPITLLLNIQFANYKASVGLLAVSPEFRHEGVKYFYL
jgi:hypothetical protein